MKKLVMIALAASTAIASPALAQDVTGTVNITGNVEARCIVLPGAGSDTFTATVPLGNLADTDGTLAGDLATRFSASGTGLQQQVVCTTANPTIRVNADPIFTGGAADLGYDNSIDYQADVTLTTISANASPYSNDSAAAAGTDTAIGSRLANVATNVSIAASNFRTGAATDLLVAGDYTGLITIVIGPGT